MHLVINGKAETCAEGTSVAALLDALGYNRAVVAVAVNREFLPRARHADHVPRDGDEIEILSPRQGG